MIFIKKPYPELMGAVYFATLVTNTQFVSTHYLTLMTVNGKACHNYCRETKIAKPMTSINISLPVLCVRM